MQFIRKLFGKILSILYFILVMPLCVEGAIETVPKLSEEEKNYLLQLAEGAIKDFFASGKQVNSFPEKYAKHKNAVYVILWRDGKRVGSWYSRTDNLAYTVYKATWNNLLNNKVKNGAGLQVHIQIMGGYEPLDGVDDLSYSRGVYGLRVVNGKKAANYYSTFAIEGNYRRIKLINKLILKAGAGEEKIENNRFYKYKTLHFARSLVSDDIVTFYRGNTANFEVNWSRDELLKSRDAAEKWIFDNLNVSGYFNYAYSPSNGKYSKNNNMIRQLMSARYLAKMSSEKRLLLPKHRKNLQFIMKNWYREDGENGYIFFHNKSKLGANGLALRVLLATPFFAQYKEQARKLANSIVGAIGINGQLEPWFKVPEGYNLQKERLLCFYSGEALLALGEYYEKVKDEKILQALIRSQDYYLQKYVVELQKNYYPAYVPWHSQSLYHLYKITGDEKYARAVLLLNDKLLELQNKTGKPFKDYLGRFYNSFTPQYGSPHSSSDAVYTEGVAYAYELAREMKDKKRVAEYKKSLQLAVHNLLNLQYQVDNCYFMQHPERVKGALRYSVVDNRIRVDTTQHMLDAYEKIVEFVDEIVP